MRPHILRNIDSATLGNLKKFLNLQMTIENERSWSPRAISSISCVATPNTRERSRNAINCPTCTSQSMSTFVARMFFSSQVFDVAAGPSGISVSGRCGSLRQLRHTTEIYVWIRKKIFPERSQLRWESVVTQFVDRRRDDEHFPEVSTVEWHSTVCIDIWRHRSLVADPLSRVLKMVKIRSQAKETSAASVECLHWGRREIEKWFWRAFVAIGDRHARLCGSFVSSLTGQQHRKKSKCEDEIRTTFVEVKFNEILVHTFQLVKDEGHGQSSVRTRPRVEHGDHVSLVFPTVKRSSILIFFTSESAEHTEVRCFNFGQLPIDSRSDWSKSRCRCFTRGESERRDQR